MTGTLVPVSVTLTQVNALNDSTIAIHFQTDGHDLERVPHTCLHDSTQSLEITEHVFFHMLPQIRYRTRSSNLRMVHVI